MLGDTHSSEYIGAIGVFNHSFAPLYIFSPRVASLGADAYVDDALVDVLFTSATDELHTVVDQVTGGATGYGNIIYAIDNFRISLMTTLSHMYILVLFCGRGDDVLPDTVVELATVKITEAIVAASVNPLTSSSATINTGVSLGGAPPFCSKTLNARLEKIAATYGPGSV